MGITTTNEFDYIEKLLEDIVVKLNVEIDKTLRSGGTHLRDYAMIDVGDEEIGETDEGGQSETWHLDVVILLGVVTTTTDASARNELKRRSNNRIAQLKALVRQYTTTASGPDRVCRFEDYHIRVDEITVKRAVPILPDGSNEGQAVIFLSVRYTIAPN